MKTVMAEIKELELKLANADLKDLSSKIKGLGVEEKVDFGKFYVKKKSRGEYCLMDTTNKVRSRWGTFDQIVKDVEFALTHDSLPPESGGRW